MHDRIFTPTEIARLQPALGKNGIIPSATLQKNKDEIRGKQIAGSYKLFRAVQSFKKFWKKPLAELINEILSGDSSAFYQFYTRIKAQKKEDLNLYRTWIQKNETANNLNPLKNLLLGFYYYEINSQDKALEYLQTASIKNIDAIALLGSLYLNLEKSTQGLEYLDIAVNEKNPLGCFFKAFVTNDIMQKKFLFNLSAKENFAPAFSGLVSLEINREENSIKALTLGSPEALSDLLILIDKSNQNLFLYLLNIAYCHMTKNTVLTIAANYQNLWQYSQHLIYLFKSIAAFKHAVTLGHESALINIARIYTLLMDEPEFEENRFCYLMQEAMRYYKKATQSENIGCITGYLETSNFENNLKHGFTIRGIYNHVALLRKAISKNILTLNNTSTKENLRIYLKNNPDTFFVTYHAAIALHDEKLIEKLNGYSDSNMFFELVSDDSLFPLVTILNQENYQQHVRKIHYHSIKTFFYLKYVANFPAELTNIVQQYMYHDEYIREFKNIKKDNFKIKDLPIDYQCVAYEFYYLAKSNDYALENIENCNLLNFAEAQKLLTQGMLHNDSCEIEYALENGADLLQLSPVPQKYAPEISPKKYNFLLGHTQVLKYYIENNFIHSALDILDQFYKENEFDEEYVVIARENNFRKLYQILRARKVGDELVELHGAGIEDLSSKALFELYQKRFACNNVGGFVREFLVDIKNAQKLLVYAKNPNSYFQRIILKKFPKGEAEKLANHCAKFVGVDFLPYDHGKHTFFKKLIYGKYETPEIAQDLKKLNKNFS